ncbi:MAG: hypothetical protein IKW45_02700 [Clostridia bacterium]|nr:hypothetical protein [Clostridia bacterium]
MNVKSISGHFSHKYYINHNNRTGNNISSNIDTSRTKNNYNKVTAGSKNCEGVYCASLSEIYNKVFEPSWQEFQQKQRPARRFNGTYLDYIRQKQLEESKNKNANTKSKMPHECSELILQIGNSLDSGIKSNPDDFAKASVIMRKTLDYICELPYVIVITEKELNDPNWKPPSNCIVLVNSVTNEDESTVHCHISFLCVASSERGCKVQNSLSKCFENLGYPTTYTYALDDNGNRIPKRDKEGCIVTDAQGNVIYKKEVDKKGVIDWISDIQEYIEHEMDVSYGWKRAEPTGSKRKHMSVQEYKNYANSLSKLKKEINNSYDEYQTFNNKFYESISKNNYNLDYFKSKEMSNLWEQYKTVSSDFWDWYKREKTLLSVTRKSIKTPEEQRRLELNYINQLLFRSNSLLEIIILLIAKLIISLKQRDEYDNQIQQVIKKQNELKQLAKDMSTKNAAVRKELKDNHCHEELIKEMQVLKEKLIKEYNGYEHKEISDPFQIFD